MVKRVLSIIMAALLLLCSMAVVAEAEQKTATATAQGFGGVIEVTITAAGDDVIDCVVVGEHETPGVGSMAIEQLPVKIVENDTWDVEGISGATVTSAAIRDAAKAAMAELGLEGKSAAAKEEAAVELKDEKTQLVIVGAGSSGIAAAIKAAENGLEAIVVEKMGIVGGTSALASTGINAGGSSMQLAMDPPYTADDYYKKIMGNDAAEDEGVRVMVNESGEVIDWLAEMGADVSRVINGSAHTPHDGSAFGAMLIPVMTNRMEELGVEYRLNTKATELIAQDGKVTGVKVETADGSYNIFADAVLLATGGFASNPEKVDEYTPQWSGYPSTAAAGATGDGLDMALAVGATLGNMNMASPQTVAYDTGNGAVSLTNVRYNGAIIVNEEGQRFANELGSTAVLGAAIKEQTNGHAFLVFDQASVDHAELMSRYKEKGYFTEAATLEELADTLGIDAEALVATVEKYRKVVETGEDPDFGRTDSIFSSIDQAPYYGVLISPANQTTNGGINIDAYCRVLNGDGEAIEGLYASGETANRKGNGMTVSTVLGYIAADAIAADLAK